MSLLLLGFGRIGQRLCKQAMDIGINVIGVADSSSAIFKEQGISTRTLSELALFKQNNALEYCSGKEEHVLSLEDICQQLSENCIVADCSASDDTTKHLIALQKRNIPIVLANKKPLTSGAYSEFLSLTQNKNLIRFESTVGAGLPVITSLNRILESGDTVVKIQGQLSGTLGFILSELQSENVTFSETICKAKAMGYTEPDPRDDLSGMDVARKALILARMLGQNINISDVEIEALYPDSMKALSIEEFMDNLHCLDDGMQHRNSNALKNGKRLRYAATISSKSAKVGLVEVGSDDALYNLVGTDNSICIKSEWYKSPMCISGPGAGVDVTAAGVLSDVCDLLRLKRIQQELIYS